VTQPRRLSAIAVADRVAAERGEKIGDTVRVNCALAACCCVRESGTWLKIFLGLSLIGSPLYFLAVQVGYSIRLETKKSQETRLLFCTTGTCTQYAMTPDPCPRVLTVKRTSELFDSFLLFLLKLVMCTLKNI
jgi:hypothetical protein